VVPAPRKSRIFIPYSSMWKDNFFFRNANGFNVVNGKTRHTGVELSFVGELTDWLTLSGDGTLARHTYNFDLDEGSAANNITSGDRVDTAPDTLAHMRATLTHDIFVLRGRYNVSDAVTLFGRVDNLFDTRFADRADFAFGNQRFFPGRPRTLFFGVSSNF